MKKYLKLQAKKSLSLFMAVLMLMTCWVWVAPEKAEAANAENGEYKVRLAAWSDDDGQVSSLTANVYYDGGSKAMTAADLTNAGTSTGTKALNNYTITAATCDTLPGFPTKFDVNIKIDGCNGHKNGTYFFQLQVWDNDDSKWVIVNNDSGMGIGWSDFNGEKSIGTDDGRTHTMDSVKPEAKTIKLSSGEQETKTLSIPEITATNEVSVICTTPGVYDQYGVRIKTPTAYKVTDSTGNTVYNKDDHGIWCDGTTVKANANVQKNLTAGTSVYLTSEYEGIKGTTAKINLTYPTYTVTVNPNGGTMAMSNGTPQNTTWEVTKAYGVTADAWPTGGRDANNNFIGATKTGNTFKGFWSAPQPESGDAYYDTFEADFANPVDTTTFTNYVNNGGVQDDKYVTVTNADGTESKYYNAGKEWNAATDRQVTGNAEYHAWWISQDITVKFYDIDGKFLGTQTTKYGKTEAENWYPDPKDTYNAGAYEYETFAKQWRDITGVVITEGSYEFGPLASLTLTPVYKTKTYQATYNITFINPVNGQSSATVYNYRDTVDRPTFGMPNALKNDAGYTYEFEGWTTQKPAKGNYHAVAQGDSSVAVNTDWVVREDLTYYAVYRSTVKQYLIAFSYTDSTGATKTDVTTISYGSPISTPANVNRTYASGGYGFTLEGWDYVNNDSVTVMLAADGVVTFNTTNVFLTAENLAGATPEAPIVFTANYDEGQPTPYTVTFKYKDNKGADKTVTAEVYHGTKITQDTVDKLVVPAEYDDGTALYTFSGTWQVTEGAADEAEYATDEFTSFGPTSHVTFEAVYDDGVPFHTVTYHANNMVYSERILQGSNVPAWMVQTGTDESTGEPIKEEYVPADREAETGTYKFAGWFDAEQTDKEYKVTNGTKYTTASKVNGDLNLYAQYVFEPFKFTIKFMDYTGKVQLAIAEVEAGQSFAAAFYEAQRAAQYRPADETYTYTFIGWDQPYDENNLVCEGKNVTFTAKYQPNYIYYKARWYNDIDSMNSAVPENEKVGENGLLAITNYVYEGSVYAPSVDLVIPDGKVFDGWYYKKDGVETAYQRGMTITADMNFYAKFKAAPVVYTVTTVVGSVSTEYTVAAGDTAKGIADPIGGYVDAEKHNKFVGWYSDAAYTSEFKIADTEITTDTTIYAKFEEADHVKDQKIITKVPSYYEAGTEDIWCACNKEKTLVKDSEIPMLTDTVAPTGTIYLGTQGKWSSTDAVGAAATDGEEVSLYANADTDIILTINDTGDVNNAYNPDGKGKGIKIIRGFISTGVFGAGSTEADITGIQTIFTDDSETLNNTANYVTKLGEYGSLEDGETYIAYYYVQDKAGNVLNTNVRTAKFLYDTTAPTVTLEGDSNAAQTEFCGKATVTGIETGATVTVNGEVVALTTTSAAGVGTYSIVGAGNYLIKVTDKAGNSTSKKITVRDGHTEVTTEKAVDCYEDGYKKVTCAVCGKTISETTTTTPGHQFGEKKTVAATCFAKGYDIEVCTVCGFEKKSNETSQLEHNYDGATAIIKKKATCTEPGTKIINCTLCGKGTKEEEIAIDENAHNYRGIQTIKATCTDDGKKFKECKYCGDVVITETLPKLNHPEEDRSSEITTPPTCTAEGLKTIKCNACGVIIGTEKIDKIDHTYEYVEYTGENNDDAENYPNGYIQLECKVCGAVKEGSKEAITPKPSYTVKFKKADGTVKSITKTEGESIAAADVADDTKAADNTYTYTFKGWKGADGKYASFPITVTGDAEYTAEFASKKIIYTHQFKVPTKWVSALTADSNSYDMFAEIMGAYNDVNKKPVAIPTFTDADAATDAELKKIYTFKFLGWSTTGAVGDIVETFTMTGDATFYAVFEAVPIEFSVIFYDEDRMSVIWDTTVDGGEDAKYANTVKVDDAETIVEPTKAPDADNHYEFAGWNYNGSVIGLEADFGPIKETTRVYATYTAEAHTDFELVVDETKTWAATCDEAGQKTEICKDCGYEKVTEIPKLGHDFENGETLAADRTLEDGTVIKAGSKLCVRYDECGAFEAPEAQKVTITFMADDNVLEEVELAEDDTYTYTAPAKESTAQYEYTFKEWTWTDADGKTVTSADAAITVTAGEEDAVYTATYTEKTRKYRVSYIYKTDVFYSEYLEFGAEIPTIATIPERKADNDYHYTFTGWSANTEVAADGKVDKDYIFEAEFTAEKHDMDIITETADCTTTGGQKEKCKDCGFTIDSPDVVPALGHKWTYTTVEATYDAAGYVTRTCGRCNLTEKTEDLPQLSYKKLRVTVKDGNALVDGARVTVIYGEQQWIKATGSYGYTDYIEGLVHGEYTILVSYNGDTAEGTVKISKNQAEVDVEINMNPDAGNEDDGSGDATAPCTCSCHRNGFWGVVFRFFHKIISFFTGKINCCKNPDPRY